MKNKYSLFILKFKNSLDKLLKNKIKLAKILLIVLIIVAAIFIKVNNKNKDEVKVEVNNNDNIATQEMYVDISGEVNNPGVYIVEPETRLFEVIQKAGGLTDYADTNQINQADFVEDGEKIIIPSSNSTIDSNQNIISESVEIPSNSRIININTASKDQLMTVSGIGEVTAEKIIEYRSKHRFKKKEDIMNIKGIGNAKFEKMKDEICV